MDPKLVIRRCRLGRKIDSERTFLAVDLEIEIGDHKLVVGDDLPMYTVTAQEIVDALTPFVEK